MKRRDFITSAATGVAAAGTLAAPAVAQSSPKVSWRLQSSYPRSLTTIYGGAETFSKYVSDLTDGNFEIKVFAGGEIVPGLQTIDAVINNTVEMGHTISAYKQGADPTWALATGLPFGLNARQQNAWFYHGGGNELLDPFYEANGLVAFPIGNSGCQMGGWWRKEVNTIADLQGMKIRASGLGGEILNRIGAVSQTLAPADIYPALERGTIDAAEWIGPFDDEKLGFVEVAPYYYYPGWWETGLAFHAFINLDQWSQLPGSYQQALRVASQAVNTDVLGAYDALNPAALRRLISAGAKLRPFSKEILNRCYDEAVALYSEIGASNPGFKQIADSMWDFRTEQYLWWQVAEYSADSINIASVRS
ncbi:TRAP transporter substrate-binding protein DctP [Rhodobacteraceae bacterium NNCM2]|nr:TRAP transporter substrate-binding protein DctP [Coraliihabitans acroporae]